MPIRDIVVTLLVLGTLPFILRRPHVGVLVWSWLGYMNPHRLTWGFAYSLPFAQVVAITLFVSLLVTREPRRVPVTGLTVLWWIFLGWMALTTAYAIFESQAQEQLIKIIKIQLVTFITMMVITNRDRIRQLVWVIVLSLGFYGVKGGIFTVTSGGGFHVLGPAGSFIEDNNALALALLVTLPLMQYLRQTEPNVWVKRGLLAAMVICAFSIVGSQSRGALLGGAAVMGFLWLKSDRKMVGGIGMFVLALVLLAFAPESWHERMSTIQNYEEDGSAMGRLNAWQYAINLANDRFLGGGFLSASSYTFAMWAPDPSDVHSMHSIFFSVLADHGWVGLGMFLLILFIAWRYSKFVIRTAKGSEEHAWMVKLASMIQVSLVAYVTGGAFLDLAYFDLPWHLVALLVIMRDMLRREAAAMAPVEPRPYGTPRPVARDAEGHAARGLGPGARTG